MPASDFNIGWVEGQIAALNTQITTHNGTITMNSGYTSDLKIQKSGNVVTINGYITATNAFANSETSIGTLESGYRPLATIREIIAIASAPYTIGDIGYLVIGTGGSVSILAKSGNTSKFAYFSVSYCV